MPTTSRAVPALETAWATPIFTLVTRVRDAAAPPVDDDGAWAAAEAGQTRIRTGYATTRRTASAGQYAAHLLRLRAVERVERGEAEPWNLALATSAPAIGSWDWDERMQAALDLRRTFKDLPEGEHDTPVRQARLVAAWLTHAGGRQILPVTARLAGYTLEHTPLTPGALAAAWYAVHGDRLLLELTARHAPAALVRVAGRGLESARINSLIDASDTAER